MGYLLATVNQAYGEDVEAGRILTVTEFINRLKGRPDIFGKDQGTLTSKIELVCLISAVVTGYFLSSYKPDIATLVHGDFIDPNMNNNPAVLVVPQVIERPAFIVKTPTEVPVKKHNLKRTTVGDNRESGRAAGSPTKKVANMGIFAMTAQTQIKVTDASFGEMTANGGFAEKIDAVIAGVGGLKIGGGNSSGRIVASSIGFGPGYGLTGDGDGVGGIEDLIGNQVAETISLQTRPRKEYLVSIPSNNGVEFRIGGRSRTSVMSVVMQNLPVLRYLYNKSLNAKPGLNGKITVRFAIDEFGKVIHCDVVESTIGDNELEMMVVSRVRTWRFDKIDKPGDITEIVYPFVFSAG